jgi:hypothetical protein
MAAEPILLRESLNAPARPRRFAFPGWICDIG